MTRQRRHRTHRNSAELHRHQVPRQDATHPERRPLDQCFSVNIALAYFGRTHCAWPPARSRTCHRVRRSPAACESRPPAREPPTDLDHRTTRTETPNCVSDDPSHRSNPDDTAASNTAYLRAACWRNEPVTVVVRSRAVVPSPLGERVPEGRERGLWHRPPISARQPGPYRVPRFAAHLRVASRRRPQLLSADATG